MEGGKLTIGVLAERTQCPVATIRYYEEIGLLPQAARTANGRRHYGDEDRKRLLFIKRCRDFGFSIDRVRKLVSMFQDGDRSCAEVRDMAQVHLDEVRLKIEELRQLEGSLLSFVQSCDAACIGGAARDCTIVNDLSTDSRHLSRGTCGGNAWEGASGKTSDFVEVRRG